MGRKPQKTKESFNEELLLFSEGHFSLVGEYITSKNGKCTLRCNITGKTFERNCKDSLKTKGCPYCSNAKHLFISPKDRYYDYVNDFPKLCKENKFELISTSIRAEEKVAIKHQECGQTFEIKPIEFRKNIYCRCCENKIKRISDIKNEIYDLVKDEYSLIGEYVNTKTKITLKHNICGHTYQVLYHGFKKGNRCPYCMSSKGEKKIIEFLDTVNIDYEFQKTFDDLLGVGGRNLSYDFYIPKYNTLIEYQGEFHDNSYGIANIQSKDAYEIQKGHDILKRKYADENGIKLLEIWYNDFDNINEILLEYFGVENLLTFNEMGIFSNLYKLNKTSFEKMIYIFNNFNYKDYIKKFGEVS